MHKGNQVNIKRNANTKHRTQTEQHQRVYVIYVVLLQRREIDV